MNNIYPVLQDFVPAKEVPSKDKFEMTERVPENGGLSPRFRSRIRQTSTATGGTASSADAFERNFMRVLQRVYQTIEKNDIRLAEQDRRDTIRLEWQQVALVVDRILLLVFIAVTVGTTLGIMLKAPYSKGFLFGTGDYTDINASGSEEGQWGSLQLDFQRVHRRSLSIDLHHLHV